MSSCDTRAASDLDARGELDAELGVIAQCKDPPAELLARHLDILLELGEIDDARALASAVPTGAPPALRAAATRALAEPGEKPSAATLIDQARDATSGGMASRERGDARGAARLLTRARHLFQRATGSSGRVLSLDDMQGVFWSGEHAVFRGADAASAGTGRGTNYAVLASVDRGTHALRVEAAVPTASLGDPLVPWPGHERGFLVHGTDQDLLFELPTLLPFSLPTGNAVFSPDGSSIVIAKSPGLTAYSTKDGTKIFDLPDMLASGHGQFLPDGSYAELDGDDNEGHVFIVDMQGNVVFDAPDAAAAAVSPSGKYVTVARPQWLEGRGPELAVTITRLDKSAAPSKVVVKSIMEDSKFTLRFEGNVAVLTSVMPPALMTEGITHELAQIEVTQGRVISRTVKAPNSRRDLFNAIQAEAKRALRPPRAVVDFYLHSQSFDRDPASGIETVVTGIPVTDGTTGSVDAPSLFFMDGSGKPLEDIQLTGERAVIENVSIAPGGGAALVCADTLCWMVDRARKSAVPAPGYREAYDTQRRWSKDGTLFLGFAEVVDINASDIEHGLVVDSFDHAPQGTARSPQIAACWFPPVVTSVEVCP